MQGGDKGGVGQGGPGAVTRWLARSGDVTFAAYAIFAAFSTYFCVYAFRKPFAAGVFEGTVELPLLPAIDYKILLIIAQVCGYCLSKFMGIKFVSELGARHRAVAILVLLGVAQVALLLFAVTPAPYAAIFLFLNGVPLGSVWGLVFGFLEGRRLSEVLGAGLSASFIIASGFVKTVALWLLRAGVPETWMPFATGLVFMPFVVVFVWMLNMLPPPTADDELLRTKRAPMQAADRRQFFRAYTPGLVVLTFLYMFLTAFRDFRDNFARELWAALGYQDAPTILTSAELPIAVGVLAVLASVMVVRDNHKALTLVHVLMIGGTVLIGASTAAFQLGVLPAVPWMVCVGLGLYVAYVPYGCVLFDRLIATVGFVGTSGFMIYVADSFGYLGSVGLLLYKNFGEPTLAWLPFFQGFAYVTSIVCTLCFVMSLVYFRRIAKRSATASPAATQPKIDMLCPATAAQPPAS